MRGPRLATRSSDSPRIGPFRRARDFDLSQISTIDYFSVGVNANGTLDESGPGWNGYLSQDFANLITRAHPAGDRVVLTVNDFDQSSLDQLTSSASAPHNPGHCAFGAIQAKSLDGANFDFEGSGNLDYLVRGARVVDDDKPEARTFSMTRERRGRRTTPAAIRVQVGRGRVNLLTPG